MDFNLTENQQMILEMTRDFAKKEVLPYRNEWDEKEHFPVDVLKKSRRAWIVGCSCPCGIWRKWNGISRVCKCFNRIR